MSCEDCDYDCITYWSTEDLIAELRYHDADVPFVYPATERWHKAHHTGPFATCTAEVCDSVYRGVL